MRLLPLVTAIAAAASGACNFERSGGALDPADQPPAPSGEAVALARATIAGAAHLVLVGADDGEVIDGRDLGVLEVAILDRVAELGALVGVLAAAGPDVSVRYGELLAPVTGDGTSVEVGANYPDPYAVTDAPYLYPNRATAAPAAGALAIGDGELVDYQAMLCATLGGDVAGAAEVAATTVGMFLCEHDLDREVQLREGDLDHPERAEGLTAAGFAPGFWRTGPYMVVARDPVAYFAEARLALDIDGDRRQQAELATMLWSLADIAGETLALAGERRWELGGFELDLVASAPLPRGLTFLTGTPAGVAFRPADEDLEREAFVAWSLAAATGSSASLDQVTRERLIARERDSGRYLRRGQRVEVTGTRLGRIALRIE